MKVEIKIDRKEVDKAILRMPMRCRKAAADGLDHASRSFMNELWKKRMQGPPGIKANPQGIFHRFRRVTMVDGKAIKFLTVRGSQSDTVSDIAHSSKNVFDMKVEVYSKSKVAGKLERGGTIQSGRPMPIPLNAKAKEMMTQVGPRTNLKAVFPDLKPVIINGKFFLARKQAFKKLQLLFILKKRVKVPARLGFFNTWNEHASRREQIIDEAFQKAMADL